MMTSKCCLVVLVSALLSGCIDLEAAYDECVDAGRCADDASVALDAGRDAGGLDAGRDAGALDAGTDAGLGDAGLPEDDAGFDAGIDAGFDAGVDAGFDAGIDTGIDAGFDAGAGIDAGVDAGIDAGVDAGVVAGYDGGTICSSSTKLRLRCDAPLTLGTGGSVSSAMAATSTGFLVGRATSTVVQVFEVYLDGGVNQLITPAAPISGAVQLAVDGHGAHWVAAWSSDIDTAATCVADGLPAVTVTLPDAGVLTTLGVGINAAGEVGLAASTNDGFFGHWGAHCPTHLLSLDTRSTNGAGVASTADPAGHGFRFVESVQVNSNNGYFSVATIEADAGTSSFTVPSMQMGPGPVAVIATAQGQSVFTTVSSENADGKFELGAWSTSADNTQDGQLNYFMKAPGWWSVGTCGVGCVMTGVIPALGGAAAVYFFADDSSANLRGAYDAVCGAPMTDSTISVASFGGRLGVLLTTPGSAKLYLCDPPPLP